MHITRKNRLLNNAPQITVVILYAIAQAFSTLLSLELLPSNFRRLHQLCFTFLFVLFSFCYVRVFATNPGSVDKWNLLGIPVKSEFETRECEHCRIVKPERVHHCRVCHVCILRYDHHCPWVANCIGLLNVRYFLQLLSYGALSAAYSALLNLCFVIRVMEARSVRGRKPHLLVELFAFFVSSTGAIVGLAISTVLVRLLYDQLSYAMRDVTTIELVKKEAGLDVPVYDRGGALRNLRAVLGPCAFWFLPVHVQLVK